MNKAEYVLHANNSEENTPICMKKKKKKKLKVVANHEQVTRYSYVQFLVSINLVFL